MGILLLVCALTAQLCLPALADDGDTVYIDDVGDLTALAQSCAYDARSQGKTVIPRRDISLGGVAFEPIASFGGTFEGGGHTISGLSITSSVSPAGLFGTVAATGVVRDLAVEGSVAPGGSAEFVGGVAGRSSGHIAICTNDGRVYGRREVGGVVGMAEPYVKLNLKQSSIEEVRRELNALSRAVDKTTDDAEGASGTISQRLTAINSGVSEASANARTLTDRLADTYDATVGEINRGGEILSNTVGQLDAVTKDLIAVSETATEALGYLEGAMNTLDQGDAFGELSAASDDLKTASALITDGAEAMRKGLDALSAVMGSLSGIPTDEQRRQMSDAVDGVSDGFALITRGRKTADGTRDEKGAQFYLEDARRHFESAMRTMNAASKDLARSVSSTRDASEELTIALRDTEQLLSYLDAQEKLRFRPLGDEADAEADALYDSLRGVCDDLELLNQEVKSASDLLLDDARQINRQFTALMNTLLDVAEEAEGMSLTDAVEDTSDEDVDAAVNGKVLLCVNNGAVGGDIDVGGVAGAMMVHNEMDPENEDGTVSPAFRRRYELKCILQNCVNHGAVTGKRDNVGAVCGSATLGVISGCEGYGSARSEGGDYVGGVAGSADNVVRKCWAKCALSGARYIGGVVGGGKHERSGLRVEGCRTLVDVTDSAQYAGAIAGVERGAPRVPRGGRVRRRRGVRRLARHPRL